MTNNIVTLDVREDFRAGQHPCDKIQDALRRVGRAESLRLLVPFEPVPLFEVAAKLGLANKKAAQPNGDWEVLFFHDPAATGRAARDDVASGVVCGCDGPGAKPGAVLEVDARGLQPPQPMVRILEALDHAPAHAVLKAHTDRRPVHLYGFLRDRGFTGESEEQADGSFITRIRRS